MTKMFDLSPLRPSLKKDDFYHQKFSDKRYDPWHWLKNKEDKYVLQYLKEENDYVNRVMAPFAQLNEEIFRELKSRIQEDDISIHEKDGPFWYYTKVSKGKQQPIFARTQIDSEQEEILLDVNILADGKPYFDCALCAVRPDHKFLAYCYDETGSEIYSVRIIDLQTRMPLKDHIEGISADIEWTQDNKGFYYVRLDEQQRPRYVYYHLLGNHWERDTLIYEEKDERFFVGLSKSEDQSYIFIAAHGHNMSEWYALKAEKCCDEFDLIHKREEDHEYEVSHHNGYFYILTNDGTCHYRLAKTRVDELSKEKWQDVISLDESVLLEDFELFPNCIAIAIRKMSLAAIEIYNYDGRLIDRIDYGDEACEINLVGRREFSANQLKFRYSSLRQPDRIMSFDLKTKEINLLKEQTISDKNFHPDNYETKRIFAQSRDGVRIPISLLYRKGLILDGNHPLFLYGYGSYGLSMDCGFSLSATSLVDRGFVYAIAHVRGGMELGRSWYLAGKLLQKENTFNDYIDCANELIKSGYTRPGKIVASGGSAGGMLVAASVNRCPELFAGVIANVPFVDVLTTMLDESLPLTTSEYNEWGDPNEDVFYNYIKQYSPFDNVKKQPYPAILAISGLNDFRVTFWEPTKWVAKLREHSTANRPILLLTHLEAGHGGASGRYEQLKEAAVELTFALACVVGE